MPTITIPEVEGVEYQIDGEKVTGSFEIDGDVVVTAVPLPGYKFENITDSDWALSTG